MHIELKSWNEAFSLAGQNENLLQFVHLQYAGFLINSAGFLVRVLGFFELIFGD